MVVAFRGSDGLAPEPPADRCGLALDRCASLSGPRRDVARKRYGAGQPLELGMPVTVPAETSRKGAVVAAVMIGVDPHKGSHTAVVIDRDEVVLGQVRVRASAVQAERLLAWAAAWPERTWAVEGARGMGHLLAQQLVAAGERVLDVQPKLGARVRLLAAGATNKNTPTTPCRWPSRRCARPRARRFGPMITPRC